MKLHLAEKGSIVLAVGTRVQYFPTAKCSASQSPVEWDELSYDEIYAPSGKTYAEVIEELDAVAEIGCEGAHLDPDLVPGARPRPRLAGFQHLDKTVPRRPICGIKEFRRAIYFCFSAGSDILRRLKTKDAFTATSTASTPYSVIWKSAILLVPMKILSCRIG